MIILEDICTEITSEWYIYFVVKKEKIIWIHKPLAICRDMFYKEDSSLYKDYKLLLSEDWFEVVEVDCGIASIPLF